MLKAVPGSGRKKRISMAAAATLATILAVTGCGGESDSPAKKSDAAAAWNDGASAEWETLLAAAKKEGEVTVAGFAPLAGPMAEAFQRDTGIKLNWVSTMGGELVARAMQEVSSGQVTMDLVLGSGVTTVMQQAGNLDPISPLLQLPSVVDAKNWKGGKPRYMDDEGKFILQPAESVYGWAMVNAKEVDPKDLTSWEDLLDPKYKGKIASHNPAAPGPGEAGAAFLSKEFGEEYLTKLFVDQDVQIASNTRQLAEGLARGTYSIAIGGVQQDFEQFRSEGFDLVPVLPGYLTGGFSVTGLLKGAPHPSAAAVFANWFASPAGQEIYQRVTMERTLRTDLSADDVPEYVDPDRTESTGFNGYDWTYYTKERPPIVERLRSALGDE